jgi:DNA-directed RNA polymerase subunit RPC12/RpoP
MTTRPDALGVCPECGTAVPPGRLAVAYERDDYEVQYAECPDCESLVQPE